MADVTIDGGPLSIEEVVRVARGGTQVSLSKGAITTMQAGRAVVEDVVAAGETVYGVTTGFGALANIRVPTGELEEMQLALLRSHAAGVGPALPEELVRAMLLLRTRTLATGYSGVRPLIAERLLEILNAGLVPVVPEFGSVGASGDLAQLAHLALPLVGEGEVFYKGEHHSGQEGLDSAGLEPVVLSYKEGLALLNGTEGMLAAACLAVVDAETLATSADAICAMSIEALLGTDSCFDARLHEIRPHPGQIASAANLRRLLAGSEIVTSHRRSDHAVQDAYSIRCAPQVHGACRDVLGFARSVTERELGAVTDNPVVFADTGEILSAGNFHGEPLAFALDFIAIALCEIASISERRTDRMLDPHHSNGLPPFLADQPGKNSGFMLAQYTQASLVVENRIHAHPASVDTIPTSGTQEDHVSMGWNSALKVRRVVDNTARVLGAEAMCAAQGIDCRRPLRSSPEIDQLHAAIRELVARLDGDRVIGPDIEAISGLILAGALR